MAIIKEITESEAANMSNIDTANNATAAEPVKVNNGNETELKNAIDDHIKKYLTTSLSFVQNHTHTDVKLVLGYVACIFAGVASWYGYVNSFEDSKPLTTICVAAYFGLNTVALLYGMFAEKDALFVGRKAVSGEIIRIDANLKRYSDKYSLTFHRLPNTTDAKEPKVTGKKPAQHNLTRSFGAWFDEDGVLVEKALEKDLKEGLETIGVKVEKEHTQ
jgi:signal peptidase complex subunit 2